jgi:universal stress protein G
VYHEVLAEAEAWGADLKIVVSHSLSMGTYLVGSNAEKIVRHANCSVLVVRYWAEKAILDGAWSPPNVEKVN